MRIKFNLIISHGIYIGIPILQIAIVIYSFMMCILREPSLEIAVVRPLFDRDCVHIGNVYIYNIEYTDAGYSANEKHC